MCGWVFIDSLWRSIVLVTVIGILWSNLIEKVK